MSMIAVTKRSFYRGRRAAFARPLSAYPPARNSLRRWNRLCRCRLSAGQFEKGHSMADDTVNQPTPGVLNDLPIDEDAFASEQAAPGAKAEPTSPTQTLKDSAAKLTKEATDRARSYAE